MILLNIRNEQGEEQNFETRIKLDYGSTECLWQGSFFQFPCRERFEEESRVKDNVRI